MFCAGTKVLSERKKTRMLSTIDLFCKKMSDIITDSQSWTSRLSFYMQIESDLICRELYDLTNKIIVQLVCWSSLT
jgi:hypothetical protein